MTLHDMPINATAQVMRIHADQATVHHIQSLGIIEHEPIVCIGSSPLGTPKIFRCMGTMVAVRDDLANKVEVELIETEHGH